MSSAPRLGSKPAGLRVMLGTAIRSRSSRSRVPRIRKLMGAVPVCHLLQLTFAVYLLFALHMLVTNNAQPVHIMHRHPAAALEKTAPKHKYTLEKQRPQSPQPSPLPAAPAVAPIVRDEAHEKHAEALALAEEQVDEEEVVQQRKLASPDSWPYKRPRPPTVLGFSIQGGVGNQIYNILEALYLARQVRGVLLLPAVLPRRNIREGDFGMHNVRRGSSLWNLAQLAKGTKGQHVYPYIPAMCRGRIDVLYVFLRKNAPEPPVDTIPRDVRSAACALLTVAPGRGAPDCDGLFSHTTVLVRRQNLTAGGDPTFLHELEALRRTPFPSKSPNEPLCVWIFGHSYDRASLDGDEYLYSHMHYLSANPRIVKLTKRWPLDSMAVVHVRYDEELCDTENHDEMHVCVRAHKDGRRPDPVYWAPMAQYVLAICSAMKEEGVKSIYLAASPYVPVNTVKKLKAEFGNHVRVEKTANSVIADESDVNFLERELAIRSRIFFGDFGSTWSGTVYYKRRTMQKKTHWTNVLLDVASNIGYYGHTEPLELPD